MFLRPANDGTRFEDWLPPLQYLQFSSELLLYVLTLTFFDLHHCSPLRPPVFYFRASSNSPHPSPAEFLLSGRPSPIPTCMPTRAIRFITSIELNCPASQRNFGFADHFVHCGL